MKFWSLGLLTSRQVGHPSVRSVLECHHINRIKGNTRQMYMRLKSQYNQISFAKKDGFLVDLRRLIIGHVPSINATLRQGSPPHPSSFHPLLRSPSVPTLLWCVVTRSAGSSSMTDCYFLERKRIWLLTSGPLQLQTRALYINQEVISKQRDHPPINLLGSGGITCSCNPG